MPPCSIECEKTDPLTFNSDRMGRDDRRARPNTAGVIAGELDPIQAFGAVSGPRSYKKTCWVSLRDRKSVRNVKECP